MAQVYAVTHVHVGTRAALKIPRHGLDAQMADRFLIEARAHLGLVGSQHIVPPMEVAIAPDGRPYLVTRLMGATLHSWRLDPANQIEDADQELSLWLRFGIQIALGLDAAHTHRPSIVHRDLKPPNIYVDEKLMMIDGKEVPLVQIGDFGLAWSPGDVNTPMGTPEYVSPEHSAGAPPTARSDLYSLGIVLYELIEGQVPFEGETMQILLKHRHDAVPKLTNAVVVSRVPELQDLMDRLLAKNEVDRPATARVVVNDLLSILRHFERRDERTQIGANPRGIAPTAKLPEISSDLVVHERAPVQARLVKPIAAAFIVIILAFIAAKVVSVPPEKIEPAKIDPKTLLAQPPPPVEPPKVVAPLVPLDAGNDDLGLEPIRSVKVAVAPKAGGDVPKPPACTPNDEWRQRVKLDLRDIEAQGTKLTPLQREEESLRIFGEAETASTESDCRRVERQVRALVERAIPR